MRAVQDGQKVGLTLTAALVILLSNGCQPATDTSAANAASAKKPPVSNASATLTTSVQDATLQSASATAQLSTQKPLSQQPNRIDWSIIDSGITAVDKDRFNYPFALDSAPVKAYADMYQVDAKTARYNLTVGMAVNEVLNKVLDQIGTSYVSHELTAGDNSQFVIHTNQRITPSQYRYVFAEPFAKGLSIDVKVMNDGIKKVDNHHASIATATPSAH